MTPHLLITLAMLGALLAAVDLADRRLRDGGAGERVQGARWGRRRDVRQLVVKGPEPGRMIVGHQGKRLIATEERTSVIAFAPTQTLKTRGLVVPVLREWAGPALVTSVKTDVIQLTRADREARGRTLVFDPLGESGIETIRASPLTSCGTWGGAQKVTHWIARSARSGGGLENAGFWHLAAEKLIAPLFFAAAASGGSMKEVIRWLNEGQEASAEVAELLTETKNEEAQGAWKANQNRDERQRSSIYTTAETMLTAYSDPSVLESSCDPNYRAADLLDGSSKTLYLYAPEGEQDRLRTLFSTLIMELVSVVQASAASGRPLDPPLLLALDEAANVAPIPNLAQVASTGAGQGIQLLSIFQDASQLISAYGKGAQTVFNNHKAKVIGGGMSDPETIKLIGGITGASEFRQQSETSGEGRSSATTSSTFRDLAPANVIREIKPGEAMLVYAHLPPVLIQLRPDLDEPRPEPLRRRTR